LSNLTILHTDGEEWSFSFFGSSQESVQVKS